jgi:HSP20 family protein
MNWITWNRNEAWSPWHEFARLQSDMNRIFERAGEAHAAEFPPIDAWVGEDGLRVHAQLPGFENDDVEVSVVGDTLTLKGERKPVALDPGETYHREERRTGKFVRAIQLPFAIEADAVKAVSKNGVLELTLPRARSERPRKIAVTSN